ncbi:MULTISPECIES: methyltransferase domain-containing protein [Gammaproteobacteria]|uniref:class I SAM-dependent methyltransferase n=1 Tax=Gammaproteobacteria TaxID=1236 RepID=UPI000DD0E7BF|nr:MULTISPECIES: methyltransferase domain-containing protein [Gammaproteobacteria]RTE87522.1 methyltransferase domain-containing protein [Aliidiomarina sp. B3213]TCZ92693.1 methyltransferase domain-containing protein [Lysobacter sp. N42]
MFLKPARNSKQRRKPETWEDLEHGDWWYSSLSAWLHESDPIVFGQYMVSLGQFDIPWPDCRIKAHYSVAPEPGADVIAEWTELPFAIDSVDWVSLPFVLEYSSDPHRILREADRMLRADGHMMIVCNNPWGLHNAIRVLPKMRKRAPWNSRMFTAQRIMDWLSLLNYEVVHFGYFGSGCPWPSTAHKPVKDSFFYSRVPLFSAGFAIIVRKREWPITWSKLKAKKRQRLSSSEIVPVGRHASQRN